MGLLSEPVSQERPVPKQCGELIKKAVSDLTWQGFLTSTAEHLERKLFLKNRGMNKAG